MVKRVSKLLNSMRKKYLATVIGIFILVLVLYAITGFTVKNQHDQMTEEQHRMQQKEEIVSKLESSLNGVFFRARGYYAFQSELEREQLEIEIQNYKEAINEFSDLELTEEETILVNDLQGFMTEYEEIILPLAIGLAEENDYEGLQEYANSGLNTTVNEFLQYTKEFEQETDRQLNESFDQVMSEFNRVLYIFMLITIVMIVALIYFLWRLLSSIIQPIEQLSEATNALKEGKGFSVEFPDRTDELGTLTVSFTEMKKSIQENEEELSAQNEELIAQQDALNHQQDQLRSKMDEISNLNKALDQSSVVAIINDQHEFTFINELGCEKLGYRQDEIVGESTFMIRPKYLGSAFYEDVYKTLKSGQIWTGETQSLTKEGSILWLYTSMVPHFDDNGRPFQYVLIGQDITELKAAEQQIAITLEETEKTKDRLTLYNDLNHALSTTFNKQQFLDEMVEYLSELYHFDKVMMYLEDRTLYSSRFVSEAAVGRILQTPLAEKMQGVRVSKRLAALNEQGLDDEPGYVYELEADIKGADDQSLAIFQATRIGYPFSSKESDEIQGILKRISIAFERLIIYGEVENARKLNQDIIDNVTEGLQFINPEGRMLQHNEALCKIFGIELNKGSQADPDDWLPSLTNRVKESEELEVFFTSTIHDVCTNSRTIRYTTLGDHPKVIDVYGSTVYRGEERIGTIFVHRDITRDYEIDRMKSELVSTVSHELRTPLASVLGFAELMLTKEVKPEKRKRYVETIYREAKRLTNLINDFLDLQKMESGSQQYHFQQVRLNELVLGVIDQLSLSAKHSLIVVDEANNIEVKADESRLIQVLTNLISNAIKFSPEGGDIEVKLTNEWDRVVVSITDEGIGIPTAEVSSLFQKFKRIDNSESRKIGGTGLGLAICKEIIDKHDGEIWVDSTEEKGSTFSFSIPVAFYKKDTSIIQDDQSNRVMILEDDKSLALLLSDELKANGFSVVHHYNPVRAIEDAQKDSFVSIIVDLMLGEELNGWDVIGKLRSSEQTKDIPIIVSSALDSDQETIKKYHVDKYLIKPYSPEILSAEVLSIVKNKEQ